VRGLPEIGIDLPPSEVYVDIELTGDPAEDDDAVPEEASGGEPVRNCSRA
jgi:hypothetical protein